MARGSVALDSAFVGAAVLSSRRLLAHRAGLDPGSARGCPFALRIEAELRADLLQAAVSGRDVELDARVELPQADRTEMERPRVAFLEVVRAVHEAREDLRQ